MKRDSFYILLVISITMYHAKMNGQYNTSYGTQAGTMGNYNTSLGYNAGQYEEGEHNVFIGYFAGKYSWDSDRNVFIGSQAGRSNDAAFDNTYVGYRAGVITETGGTNTFIGSQAGTYNNAGTGNVYLGSHAGYSSVGSGNVFLGKSAGYSETGSNKLYIANSGTSTPLIYGEFNNQLVGINGKLGIGINNPNESLEIYRNSAIQVASQYGNSNTGSGAGNGFIVGIDTTGNGLIWNRENNFIRFGTNGSERIRINADGKVGIGVVNPDYELDVCGTIRAKEVKVDLESGCDFVFRNDYNLIGLNELEQFVRTHQHLPGIAPEKEMIENGVNMKEMQMKLLQKIEELTLYTIALNKELENLQVRIKELEQK